MNVIYSRQLVISGASCISVGTETVTARLQWLYVHALIHRRRGLDIVFKTLVVARLVSHKSWLTTVLGRRLYVF